MLLATKLYVLGSRPEHRNSVLVLAVLGFTSTLQWSYVSAQQQFPDGVSDDYCASGQYYDGVIDKCVPCSDICRPELAPNEFCRINCREYYEEQFGTTFLPPSFPQRNADKDNNAETSATKLSAGDVFQAALTIQNNTAQNLYTSPSNDQTSVVVLSLLALIGVLLLAVSIVFVCMLSKRWDRQGERAGTWSTYRQHGQCPGCLEHQTSWLCDESSRTGKSCGGSSSLGLGTASSSPVKCGGCSFNSALLPVSDGDKCTNYQRQSSTATESQSLLTSILLPDDDRMSIVAKANAASISSASLAAAAAAAPVVLCTLSLQSLPDSGQVVLTCSMNQQHSLALNDPLASTTAASAEFASAETVSNPSYVPYSTESCVKRH